MILASHGLIASSISGVDADWLAYYNRVIAAGGSLTTTEQNATKTLGCRFKSQFSLDTDESHLPNGWC